MSSEVNILKGGQLGFADPQGEVLLRLCRTEDRLHSLLGHGNP